MTNINSLNNYYIDNSNLIIDNSNLIVIDNCRNSLDFIKNLKFEDSGVYQFNNSKARFKIKVDMLYNDPSTTSIDDISIFNNITNNDNISRNEDFIITSLDNNIHIVTKEDKKIQLWGNVLINDKLIVYDDASFNNILEVSNNLLVKGDASIKNNLEVSGNITAFTYFGDGSNLTGIDALPDQSGNSGKILITDGSNATWSNDISVNSINASGNITAFTYFGDGSNLTGIDALPDQSGNSGKILITDGSNATWSNDISVNNLDISENINTIGSITAFTYFGDGSNLTGIDVLPDQLGNTGKLLVTDGSDATWTNDISINNLDISGVLKTDIIKGGSTMIIDPAIYDNNTGNLIIKGNLEVQGNTTTINSTTLDICDNRIKLNATTSTDAGIDISFTDGTSKSFYYNKTDSEWKTDDASLNIGNGVISAGAGIFTGYISGNVTGDVTGNADTATVVKKSSFTIVNSGLGDLSGINAQGGGTFVGSSGDGDYQNATNYTASRTVISGTSCIKIEFKVNFICSPEANQTISFKVKRTINGGGTPADVFTDENIGSNMGIMFRNVYNGTFIDDLSGSNVGNGDNVTYQLQYKRNCPSGTISTNFGIVNGGNYIFLQEIYA